MGFFKDVLGKVSSVLNAVAPFAMFIPGLQWVSVAAMAANVLNGLAQKPPDWKGVLTNVVMQAVPMGLGKAVQAFGGGTAMQFAKLFGEKLSGTLGEVAKKVANPQFSNLITNLQSKITSGPFLENIAAWTNKITGTKPGDILSQKQLIDGIAKHGAPSVSDMFGNDIAQMVAPLVNDQSSFTNSQSEDEKVKIRIATGDLHGGSAADTWSVPRG